MIGRSQISQGGNDDHNNSNKFDQELFYIPITLRGGVPNYPVMTIILWLVHKI